MPRGATLFSELFTTTDLLPEKQSKGRSKLLIDKRNECLMDRYFFYVKTFNFNYSYVLEKLSEEFFLSEITIPQIMERADSQLYLRRLKMEQPAKITFEKKWPHLKWAA